MCLIVVKPKGVRPPSKTKMKRWQRQFPDGFGLAYLHQERVRILKGAMTTRATKRILAQVARSLGGAELKDVDIIMHFRQATAGQVEPKNCHPFPITDDQAALSSLDIETDIALAHNGIVFSTDDYYPGYSKYGYYSAQTLLHSKTDTQEFIEQHLVGLGDILWDKQVQGLIGLSMGGKCALLSSRGITYIGEFIEDGGLLYSNSQYKEVKKVKLVYTYNYKQEKDMPYMDADEWDADETHLCDYCEGTVDKLFHLPCGEATFVCLDCYYYLTGKQRKAV